MMKMNIRDTETTRTVTETTDEIQETREIMTNSSLAKLACLARSLAGSETSGLTEMWTGRHRLPGITSSGRDQRTSSFPRHTTRPTTPGTRPVTRLSGAETASITLHDLCQSRNLKPVTGTETETGSETVAGAETATTIETETWTVTWTAWV